MPDHDECVAVVRQLWPYLDGALPLEWETRVVAHLESCVNCRSHFDFERAFLEAIGAAAAVSYDELEPLRTRILGALAVEGFAQR